MDSLITQQRWWQSTRICRLVLVFTQLIIFLEFSERGIHSWCMRSCLRLLQKARNEIAYIFDFDLLVVVNWLTTSGASSEGCWMNIRTLTAFSAHSRFFDRLSGSHSQRSYPQLWDLRLRRHASNTRPLIKMNQPQCLVMWATATRTQVASEVLSEESANSLSVTHVLCTVYGAHTNDRKPSEFGTRCLWADLEISWRF